MPKPAQLERSTVFDTVSAPSRSCEEREYHTRLTAQPGELPRKCLTLLMFFTEEQRQTKFTMGNTTSLETRNGLLMNVISLGLPLSEESALITVND
jgi:hypothetical protein